MVKLRAYKFPLLNQMTAYKDDKINLGQKLKEAIDGGRLDPAVLAIECGVSRQAVYGWLKTGRVAKEHLPVFARLSGNPLEWWLGDSSHPAEEGHSAISTPAYNQLPDGDNFQIGPDVKGKIPLISWVQAGNWSEVSKSFTEADAEQWLPALRPMSKRGFALRVEGSSMEPRYQHGDVIYVEPEAQAEHGRRVVVQLDDEPQATFKELVVDGGHKFLRPLNPDWPGPKFLPINGNATIIGVVVGKWVPE